MNSDLSLCLDSKPRILFHTQSEELRTLYTQLFSLLEITFQFSSVNFEELKRNNNTNNNSFRSIQFLDFESIQNINSLPQDLSLNVPNMILIEAQNTNYEIFQKYFDLIYDFYPRVLNQEQISIIISFWMYSDDLFNVAQIIKLSSSSTDELTTSILSSFSKSIDHTFEKANFSINRNDLIGLSNATHAVKASAKLLGANSLFYLCKYIENKLKFNTPMTKMFKIQTLDVLTKNQKFFHDIIGVPINTLISEHTMPTILKRKT